MHSNLLRRSHTIVQYLETKLRIRGRDRTLLFAHTRSFGSARNKLDFDVGDALPDTFIRASKVDSRVEKSRETISQEEQECLRLAPSCPPHCFTANHVVMDPVAAAEVLVDEGVLRVDGLLSGKEVADLRGHVDSILGQSIQAVSSGLARYTDLFGPVLCRRRRFDVLLPLDKLVLRIVQRVLTCLAPVMEVVGEECYMCELSALVSDPGSSAQPVHHDTTFDGSNPRVTVLVALQNVTSSMGPTYLFPQTNTPEWHFHFAERGDMLEHLLESTPHVVGLLEAGDALMYDSRLLHCGGANTSHSPDMSNRGYGQAIAVDRTCVEREGRRTMLVLSAQLEEGANRSGHTNILPGYRGKYRINSYAEWSPIEEA